MELSEVIIGKWVQFETKIMGIDIKTHGYIQNKRSMNSKIFVPQLDRSMIINNDKLVDIDDTQLTSKDITDLIDFALYIRDFEWVEELRKRKYETVTNK